jgi:hypothetical protein
MPPHVFPYSNQLSRGFEQRGGMQPSGSAKQYLGRPESFGKTTKDFGIKPEAGIGPLDPLQSTSLNRCFAAYSTTRGREEITFSPHRIQSFAVLEFNMDSIPIGP